MFMFLAFIMSISIFLSTDLSIIFLQVPFMIFHYIFDKKRRFTLHLLSEFGGLTGCKASDKTDPEPTLQ